VKVGQVVEDSKGRVWLLESASTSPSDEQIKLILDRSEGGVGDMLNVPVAPTGVVPKRTQRLGNIQLRRVL